MFEKRHEKVAHKNVFYRRLAKSALLTFLILVSWLAFGIWGYHTTCHYDFYDSLLNASMILSGMGPMNPIDNHLGKVFASVYAIISGVLFITSIGVLLAPTVHRFMHTFHLPEE